MKISGAHLQMVNNQCTNFKKNPCTHIIEHAWTKSYPQTRNRQTDGQMNGQGETNIPSGGYN